MSTITTAPPLPRLQLLDDAASSALPREIIFQFQPGQFTETVAANWGSSTGLNRSNPILQFSHGEQQSFQFEARLWAQNSAESIDNQLQAMKDATMRDEALKRPARWQFSWGSFISETVVIQSIGNVRYDEIRSDGTLRGVTLEVSLLVYKTVDVTLAEVEARTTDTFFAPLKANEQWEDIALREYNDASLGDLIRQRNPGLEFPAENAGAIVKLPKLINLRKEFVEPTSIPMQRTDAGLALRAAVWGRRSITKNSIVMGG